MSGTIFYSFLLHARGAGRPVTRAYRAVPTPAVGERPGMTVVPTVPA